MNALSDALRTEHSHRTQASFRSAFVQGLGDGSLPTAAFQGYIAQDAFFLEAFARGYAVAVSRSHDRGTLEAFATLLAGVMSELKLHDGYAAKWGVRLDGVEPLGATLAYTEFLQATAATGSLAEIAAAMTPCMRLYADLGQALARAQPGGAPREDHPYGEWIRTYADPGFEGLAVTLETLLDTLAAPHEGPRLSRLYGRALDLELGFFEASLPSTA